MNIREGLSEFPGGGRGGGNRQPSIFEEARRQTMTARPRAPRGSTLAGGALGGRQVTPRSSNRIRAASWATRGGRGSALNVPRRSAGNRAR